MAGAFDVEERAVGHQIAVREREEAFQREGPEAGGRGAKLPNLLEDAQGAGCELEPRPR